MINGTQIDFSNILLDKILYDNFSVYNIFYKTLTGHCVLGSISLDDKTKHLILFDYGLFNKICDKFIYVISEKREITNGINYTFVRSELIHIILYLLKKTLTFHNVLYSLIQFLI